MKQREKQILDDSETPDTKKERIITFDSVTFSYGLESVLENISFTVLDRDFIGLIGPNGGGKTTILKLLLGLLAPDTGIIKVAGLQPRGARRLIGYMPQYIWLDDDFPITVEEVVAMGLFTNDTLFPFISKEKKNQIKETMESVRISDLAGRQFGKLSGGQKQRCLIARAIVSRPRILLLDEPTASVDSRVEKDIYELLSELNKQMTILLVSHDLGFISSYINRVFCINRAIACHSTDSINLTEIIKEAYEGPVQMIHHHCNL